MMRLTKDQFEKVVAEAVGAGTGVIMATPEGQGIVMPSEDALSAVRALVAEHWREDDAPAELARTALQDAYTTIATVTRGGRGVTTSDIAAVQAIAGVGHALLAIENVLRGAAVYGRAGAP